MARYIHDYRDISGEDLPARGMDPNYRGRYRGMRMQADPGQGAYGWYRWRHAGDLGENGGFGGRGYPQDERVRYDRDFGARRFYDWEMHGGGGLRNPRYDREFLRDFNSESQAYRGEGRHEGRYGVDYRERGGHPVHGDPRYRFDYGNRGLASGGFSEAWQHRPGRGSR
jgi:hypothetical protein